MKLLNKINLETKLFLVFNSLVIIPLIVIVFIVMNGFFTWQKEELVRDNRKFTHILNEEIEELLQKFTFSLDLILKIQHELSLSKESNSSLMNIQRFHDVFPEISSLELVDFTGKTLEGTPIVKAKNSLRQEIYKEIIYQTLSKGATILRELHVPDKKQETIFYVATPYKKNNMVKGILIGRIQKKVLDVLIEGIELESRESLFLLDKEGNVLFYKGNRQIIPQKNIPQQRLELLRNNETIEYYFQGVPTMAKYLPVEINGWAMVFQRPTTIVYAHTKSFIFFFPYILGGLIVLIPIIIFFSVRKIVSPLKRLVFCANQIASGNFNVVIESNSEDEIGLLAQSFSIMRDRISEKIEELRKNYSVQSKLIEEERARISKELHDVVLQQFGLISRSLSIRKEDCTSVGNDINCQITQDRQLILDLLKTGEMEIRRIMNDLYPQLLKDLGLVDALESYINGFNNRLNTQIEFHKEKDIGRLSPDIELVFFRIVQESIANIVKHSKTNKGEVFLGLNKNKLWLQVEDQGQGFDADHYKKDGHHGLVYMHDRAEQIGAHLTIHSELGQGTSLFLEVSRN